MIQNWVFLRHQNILHNRYKKSTSRNLSPWSRVLIMKAHDSHRYQSEKPNTCMGFNLLPFAASPQESPQLVPWAPYVPNEQSSCGFFGASALHPHPWYHLLIPFVYDEGNLQAIMVLHLHTYDRMSLCVVTQKHVFWFYITKNTKNLIIQKNLKRGFGTHYQCHCMLLLVVGACQDLPENIFSYRDNHRWK